MKQSSRPSRQRLFRSLFCLILIAASCVLGGAAELHRRAKDTTPPTIICPEEEAGFILGADTAILLQGVTAADPEDGDVTASVRIRSISVASNQRSAIVTYAARDQANNIGMEKRYVKVTIPEKDPPADAVIPQAGDSTDREGTP